ncbi:MAG: type IV secretory system conjugative DNA transfer family protein [Oscillospiraceae bacterium]|nr:type IV secretory system conjugative DNA transfer family protein [Oscillospiraceae bacterium]
MTDKKRTIGIILAVILGLAAMLYIGGVSGQLLSNYSEWMEAGGLTGEASIKRINWNPIVCLPQAFTPSGLKGMLRFLVIGAAIFLYVKLHDKFDGKEYDPRGFTKSKNGIYGTAAWMSDKEMQEELEIAPVEKAEGVILGEYKGKAVCMPKDTRLNRHIAVFGASGTMKSRAIIRNALFQAIKRNESVILTDPKGELYADTAELFRKNGYEVKVFNLVTPEHGDSWNCMSDLNGDTLLAQVLTNVIIGNTTSGKGDHFWDNGEGNLLKALILYIDQDHTRSPEEKNLPAVYQMLTRHTERQLTAMFEKLPMDHPARAPFNLFAQSSDTVKSGIILGLGTRLQVLQNEAVRRITSRSDIDLTAPAKRKCAYYIILSDSESSMGFLSSLFFSFLLIKLPRYADSRPDGRCDVPVNLILDEFNNVGRLGGAADGSDFARSLSTVRSREIKIMIAVQSLGQLQNRYPNNLWSEIIGNVDIQLMLGCSDDVTAEQFSVRSGDMSVQVNSTMTVRQTLAVAQMIPLYRHTEGQGRRRLLTPDEVLRLPNEEMLCVIRGRNMLKLRKLDFTKHPMSKQIERRYIMDYRPKAQMPIFEPQTHAESTPTPEPQKPTRKRSLYSSAQPPTEF